jgi:hypothetical protein
MQEKKSSVRVDKLTAPLLKGAWLKHHTSKNNSQPAFAICKSGLVFCVGSLIYPSLTKRVAYSNERKNMTGDLLKAINHQSAKADSFFVKEACKEILVTYR